MQFRAWFAVVALQAIAACHGRSCPSFPVVKDFSEDKFVGTWYQQKSKDSSNFGTYGLCVKHVYGLDDKTNEFSVVITQKFSFNRIETLSGTVEFADKTSNDGKLEVTFNTKRGKDKYHLLVLATDYENFAILHTCQNIYKPAESFFVLTREKVLKGGKKEAVYKLIEEAFVQINKVKETPKLSEFEETNQEYC